MNEPAPDHRSSAVDHARSTQPPGGFTFQLQEDQRRRWHAGERVRVEAYLEQHPALQDNVEAILELIYQEMVLQEECSEPAGLEDYLRRFPQYASQVKNLFEVHGALQSGHVLDPDG